MTMQTADRSQDIYIAGGLITAPAWAPWLSGLNEILTTGTLLVGLALGVARLWSLYKQSRKRQKK